MNRSVTACLLTALILQAPLGAPRAVAHVPDTVDMTAAPTALTRLFQADAAKPEWFTPGFLEEVPIDRINAVLASVRQQYGSFVSQDGSGLDYAVHLARGSVHVRIVVDHEGLIAGLLITPNG